ncbi:hypothetical protein BDB00DRAFT_931106 [Zychaea mexicana]|uniref:uncharacterized protein n=1 Tax=Zychaea mexicana TaxID=64656 RepID=UPI0022FE56AF|nr:uncharacterized protein BDB00DRAFT_931106 [Zychaea mexicana]KAI9490587.1 hypothetical protein BDB00DRAFT_931106 [Zychaea mexicana]
MSQKCECCRTITAYICPVVECQESFDNEGQYENHRLARHWGLAASVAPERAHKVVKEIDAAECVHEKRHERREGEVRIKRISKQGHYQNHWKLDLVPNMPVKRRIVVKSINQRATREDVDNDDDSATELSP